MDPRRKFADGSPPKIRACEPMEPVPVVCGGVDGGGGPPCANILPCDLHPRGHLEECPGCGQNVGGICGDSVDLDGLPCTCWLVSCDHCWDTFCHDCVEAHMASCDERNE